MQLASTLLILIGWVLLCLLLIAYPGWIWLRWWEWRGRRLDTALAVATCGVCYWTAAIWILGLAGLYTRTALLLLIAPPAFAHVRLGRSPSGLVSPSGRTRQAVEWWNRAAVFTVALLLGYLLIMALTSPYRLWDGVISWDKWATDWASHRGLAHYLFGGYTQMVPIVHSLIYKLSGSPDRILPLELFANHGLHVLWSALLLAGLFRLAALWSGAAWFAVLAYFGWYSVQQYIPSGYADFPAAGMTASALALTVARTRGEWSCRRDECVLAPAWLAAWAAKMTSLVWVLLAFLWAWTQSARSTGRIRLTRRSLIIPLSIAASAALAFLIQQIVLDRYLTSYNMHQPDHLFSFEDVRRGLHSHLTSVVPDRSPLGLARFAAATLTSPAHEGLRVDYAVGLWLIGGFLLGWLDRSMRLPILFVCGYALLFVNSAAYDFRNFAGALVLVCAVASRGVQLILSRIPGKAAGLTALVLVALLIAHLGRSAYLLARAQPEPMSIDQRLKWIDGPEDAKAVAFFPEYAQEIVFLRYAPVAVSATHILAPSPMYRLIRKGIYPLRMFWWPSVPTGDILMTRLPVKPPQNQTWAELPKVGESRVYVRLDAPSP